MFYNVFFLVVVDCFFKSLVFVLIVFIIRSCMGGIVLSQCSIGQCYFDLCLKLVGRVMVKKKVKMKRKDGEGDVRMKLIICEISCRFMWFFKVVSFVVL